ncbi:Vanillyl-alcohol oxidase [Pyrenophora seminiperda CCB06]|uniref:Vanillyl-alcohol oxidase n=1 Tax=Pyrenophora seminiperda CCB06 TaxID=1302712 RepID=A0A3M7M0A9_9PLEO|nr:Vanillyl-alcohol oxidase [Pyrenophora seminiperda CCB06]
MDAVVFAYFSDSIAENYMTETDTALIEGFQAILQRLLAKQPFRSLLSTLRESSNPQQKLSRKQREEALNSFILSLSDQQLATGLAILIAAIANQCTLSPPDFRVAFALAWFSTTTHLATLDSLRQYFVQHPALRNVRIIGMLIFMVLFLYCFIVVLIMESSPDNLVPVQCHVQGSVNLYNDQNTNSYSPYFVPWAMTILFLIFEYKSALLRTYEYDDKDVIGLGAWSKNILAFWSRLRHPKQLHLPHMSAKEWSHVRNEVALEFFASRRRELLDRIMQVPAKTKPWRRFIKILLYAEHRYAHSLLPLAFPMTFMVTYGFVQMLMFRLELGDINGIEFDSSMGFGQIIPLILLALPFLAAAELYSESKTLTPETKFSVFNSVATGESMPDVAINQTSDFPTLSNSDWNGLDEIQLEQNAFEYAAQITFIQRYFYADTEDIQSLQIMAKTEQEIKEILKKKAALLKATTEYREAEKHMKGYSLVMALIMFSRLSVAIVMPVIINLGKNSVSGSVGGCWIAALGINRFITWAMTLRKIKVESLLNKTDKTTVSPSLRSVLEYVAAANGRLAHPKLYRCMRYGGRRVRSQRIHIITPRNNLNISNTSIVTTHYSGYLHTSIILLQVANQVNHFRLRYS